MSEYIEKEAVINFIENGLNNPDKTKSFGHDAIEIMAEVRYMPAADVVEVRHGKWNKNGNGRDCSICGFKYYANGGLFNFCPNCGAKMDGGNNNA